MCFKNNLNLKIAITIFLTITLAANSLLAQETTKAGRIIDDLVQRYDGTKGVDCIVASKGRGLALIKMTLNSQFGKEFMKGVTNITIIEYSSATEKVCMSLRKDLDAFQSVLTEFDLNGEYDPKEYKYMRCLASISDSNSLNDFVIALESDSDKMLMYMGGEIVINK